MTGWRDSFTRTESGKNDGAYFIDAGVMVDEY